MAVAKGNWGCGSVYGEIRFQVVIQIHDSIATGRSLRHYMFGNQRLKDDLEMIFDLIVDSEISTGLL